MTGPPAPKPPPPKPKKKPELPETEARYIIVGGFLGHSNMVSAGFSFGCGMCMASFVLFLVCWFTISLFSGMHELGQSGNSDRRPIIQQEKGKK